MSDFSLLLVDDEPAIVESLARDLECSSYSVDKATDGAEAIELLEEARYHLVITDLVMPGTGGLEVVRTSKDRYPDTGVFILTGYGDMNSAIEALRLGADDYLIKPCNPEELMLRIERYLEKQRAMHAIRFYEDILPVCSYCKKIRNTEQDGAGRGEWITLEELVLLKSDVMVSHGCCPECFEKYKDEL